MKLYKNGFVVAKTDDENSFYNAWPLSELTGDKMAEALTNEADDNWFIKYNMQHIVPDVSYVRKYLDYCNEMHLEAKALLFESMDNHIAIEDNIEITEVLGFDCIGTVYHSYLKTEYEDFKKDLMKQGIALNKYGLLDTIDDILYFIKLRKQAITSGLNLENFWEEFPVKISIVNIF